LRHLQRRGAVNLGDDRQQERIRISERVHAGLAKARKRGRIGGRPRLVLSHARVLALSQEGATIREIAEEMGVSPASIHLKGNVVDLAAAAVNQSQ
jgi:DNA invertase Pin-like site-specific DNA recombinase